MDFSRGAKGHLEMILPSELGLNDKLAFGQQLHSVTCPLYIFENVDLPPDFVASKKNPECLIDINLVHLSSET